MGEVSSPEEGPERGGITEGKRKGKGVRLGRRVRPRGGLGGVPTGDWARTRKVRHGRVCGRGERRSKGRGLLE